MGYVEAHGRNLFCDHLDLLGDISSFLVGAYTSKRDNSGRLTFFSNYYYAEDEPSYFTSLFISNFFFFSAAIFTGPLLPACIVSPTNDVSVRIRIGFTVLFFIVPGRQSSGFGRGIPPPHTYSYYFLKIDK